VRSITETLSLGSITRQQTPLAPSSNGTSNPSASRVNEKKQLVPYYGPIPTTAGLCVLFLLIAVISSGLVKIAASTL
jgi:hypothetical protein